MFGSILGYPYFLKLPYWGTFRVFKAVLRHRAFFQAGVRGGTLGCSLLEPETL